MNKAFVVTECAFILNQQKHSFKNLTTARSFTTENFRDKKKKVFIEKKIDREEGQKILHLHGAAVNCNKFI
jgi:hypothetical protein